MFTVRSLLVQCMYRMQVSLQDRLNATQRDARLDALLLLQLMLSQELLPPECYAGILGTRSIGIGKSSGQVIDIG